MINYTMRSRTLIEAQRIHTPGCRVILMSRQISYRALTKRDFAAISELRYQIRRFLRFSERAVRRAGITPLQYLLLLHLRGFPGRDWATIAELAERLQAQHHGVVALVLRCEALGFVIKRRGRADRRQVEVHLAPKGEENLHRLALLHRAELRALHRAFGVTRLAAFNDEGMQNEKWAPTAGA